MKALLELLFKGSMEWVYFLIVIMVLFNTLTEFLQQIGLLGATLTVTEIQYYGILSMALAINNFLSQRFFGLELFK